MKYTSLLCAAVAAAALGSFAADGTRTPVVEEPFDAAPTGAMFGVYASIQTSSWTVNEVDESAIVAAPISQAEALDGYNGKSLLLNTQGQELQVAAVAQDAKSEIKMKLRLVASDTAPGIDAQDVHAAVYLLEQNPEEPTEGDGLYAYTYDEVGQTNKWEALTAPTFTVANGDMIALKVVMDYTDGITSATYAAVNLGDDPDQVVDDEDYIDLGTVFMANATNNQDGHLKSVAFKGTGSVDDLFITSIEQVATSATIVFNLYVDGDYEDELVEQFTINDVADFSANFLAFDPTDYGEDYVIVSVDVWKDGATPEQATLVASLDPADLYDGTSDYYITEEEVALEAGESYEVRVMVGPPAAPSAYVGPKSGTVQILCAADETAYGQGFVPLSFTSIAFVTDENSGDVSIVAEFDATVVFDNDATSGTADFGVITTSALDGATTVLTGSVTATAAGGTVTIPMPAGDALFLKGFTTAPAPAGD